MSMRRPPTTAPPGTKQRAPPTILVYPTVSPESVVVPIVSCIFGFPLLALLVICCLRRRAKMARERDRRRAGNYEADRGTMSLVRFSPFQRLGGAGRGGRAVSLLRGERGSLARGFPSLDMELDTVVEERSSDPDNTTTSAMELLASPPDSS